MLSVNLSFFAHEIDHVIPEKHAGNFSFLFNPRKHNWSEHFQLDKFQIIGLTPEGRTTVKLLQFNTAERLVERKKAVN